MDVELPTEPGIYMVENDLRPEAKVVACLILGKDGEWYACIPEHQLNATRVTEKIILDLLEKENQILIKLQPRLDDWGLWE